MPKPATTINELIEITRDGIEFYTDAIAKVNNPRLKIVFRRIVDAKSRLIGELAGQARARGAAPSTDGTFAGRFRRLYADLRARVGDKDATFVAQLEEAEDRLLSAFEDAAREADDTALYRVVMENLPRVRMCHEQMRNLKMELAA